MYCGADVPTINGMKILQGTLVGIFMDQDIGAKRSQGCIIVIKYPIKLGVGWEIGTNAALAEEVKGDGELWE